MTGRASCQDVGSGNEMVYRRKERREQRRSAGRTHTHLGKVPPDGGLLEVHSSFESLANLPLEVSRCRPVLGCTRLCKRYGHSYIGVQKNVSPLAIRWPAFPCARCQNVCFFQLLVCALRLACLRRALCHLYAKNSHSPLERDDKFVLLETPLEEKINDADDVAVLQRLQ